MHDYAQKPSGRKRAAFTEAVAGLLLESGLLVFRGSSFANCVGPIDRRFGPTPALLWNNWRAHEYVILRRVDLKASLFLPVDLKD
jgi:hypothetical protein